MNEIATNSHGIFGIDDQALAYIYLKWLPIQSILNAFLVPEVMSNIVL